VPVTTRSVAVTTSAGALVVVVVATLIGAAITSGASTSQRAAFIVTWISTGIGIAAGLVAASASEPGRKTFPWAAANLVVGLACIGIELLAAVDNM
jgi:hypothetical protein